MASVIYGIFNMLLRNAADTKAVKRIVDFSGVASAELNFFEDYQTGQLPGFETVWIDNRQNANAVALTIQGTGQVISMPGNYQGFVPVLAIKDGNATITSTVAANAKTEVIFLTVQLQAASWPASNSSAVGAATAANQATQISQGTTANGLLQDILDELSAGGGDATAANQVTGNNILANILTELATIANEATQLQNYAELQAANINLNQIEALLSGTLLTKPVMAAGGFLVQATNAVGATWNAFANQAARQMVINNKSGVPIVVRQGGGGASWLMDDKDTLPIFGISNTNEIQIRRSDSANIQVDVQARWES